MAKADLKNLEEAKGIVGRAVKRCFELAGLTQKEAAARLERDQAQVARWIAGAERPQVDVFVSAGLLPTLVLALAELSGVMEISTTVTIRRSA